MSGKTYHEIYLHIIWRTKSNAGLIDAEIEAPLHNYLRNRCMKTPGVFFHVIGGTRDHVHLCVSVPPSLLISEWIGDLKGSSSHYINHNVRRKALQWQAGYGVVSFGKNNLDFVKDYIANQKEHHQAGKTHDRLEITETDEPVG